MLKSNTRNIIAFIITLGLCLVVLWSSMFIVIEAEHDCSGEDCPVCLCIAVCGSLLRLLSLPREVSSAWFSALILSALTLIPSLLPRNYSTLITLKVKLSD